MKKLLLVLLVVALASFLFVGCFAVPNGAEGEGEGEGEPELCPTLTIEGSIELDGKTYVKSSTSTKKTVTIVFSEATEGVAVYFGYSIKGTPTGVPENAPELVTYTTDNITYTGKTYFIDSGEPWCDEAYIYVTYGDPCCPVVCKYPLIVDGDKPYAEIAVKTVDSGCLDKCKVNFKNITPTCETMCCGDGCTGLASWKIDVYDKWPFDVCCDPVCEDPIDSGSGIVCPIDWTTKCIGETPAGLPPMGLEYLAIITLEDKVGNKTTYYAQFNITVTGPSGECELTELHECFKNSDPADPTECLTSCIPVSTIGTCE